MQNYRKTSHTTYDCKYHIVWITKYRKAVLQGIVAERVRELIREICKENEVEIINLKSASADVLRRYALQNQFLRLQAKVV